LRALAQERSLFILSEQLRKLDILMAELRAPKLDDPLHRLIWLSIELAKKLYPGFSTETEAKPRGRPRGARPFSNPEIVLILVEALRRHGHVQSDDEAARFLLACENEGLDRPHRKTELAKKARTLAGAVSRARAAKRRKDGEQVSCNK
jgi:hypothetical protein